MSPYKRKFEPGLELSGLAVPGKSTPWTSPTALVRLRFKDRRVCPWNPVDLKVCRYF
jgi:hypothetical protein